MSLQLLSTAPGAVPAPVTAAARRVGAYVMALRKGAYYHIEADGGGVPRAVLVCVAGTPEEIARVAGAVEAAVREGGR